jgi:hypothetical protein
MMAHADVAPAAVTENPPHVFFQMLNPVFKKGKSTVLIQLFNLVFLVLEELLA